MQRKASPCQELGRRAKDITTIDRGASLRKLDEPTSKRWQVANHNINIAISKTNIPLTMFRHCAATTYARREQPMVGEKKNEKVNLPWGRHPAGRHRGLSSKHRSRTAQLERHPK